MKRILIAPLDWGLGHATRCIPIAQELLRRNFEIMFAGSGDSLELLKKEFPGATTFQLPGYTPTYPTRGMMMPLTMAKQLPKFVNTIMKEHIVVENIIKQNEIDAIISDNRYGCWSHQVPSIFITHQSNILMPKRFGWMAGTVRKLNERYMKKFTECWIPDYPAANSLAGKLASFGKIPRMLNARNIGPLSRFRFEPNVEKRFDVVAIFSGPEPQRTMIEKIVYDQLRRSNLRYMVVRGQFSDSASHDPRVVNFMTAYDLEAAILAADVVIARSGYSTVMDMAALQKKVIFIPTPGQTEQEYLAKTLSEKNICCSVAQHEFQLAKAMDAVRLTTGFTSLSESNTLLKDAIDSLVGCVK